MQLAPVSPNLPPARPQVEIAAAPAPAVAPGARTYAQPGYDDAALARITGWIGDVRDVLVRAGLPEVAQLAPVRVDFVPGAPAHEMQPERGVMLLGEYAPTHAPASVSDDLVRHEYVHYVLAKLLAPNRLAGDEAATLHESLADTFAAAAGDDWQLGEELYGSDGRMSRSMSNPADGHNFVSYGVERLPAHMSQIPRGGAKPHVNVGIPNRAAYLVGSALGRERMASLYVAALRDPQLGSLNFEHLGAALARAATDDRERTTVLDAWRSVGVDPLREAR